MQTKICGKCKEEKEVCEFGIHNSTKDRLRTSCKECRKIDGKIYRENNVKKRKETLQNWYNKNPNYNKEYYLNNFEYLNKKNKEWYNLNTERHRETSKKWSECNREKINEYSNNRIKIIRKTDPLKTLIFNVRSRVYNFLKSKNIIKQNKTFDIVGCSPEFLKEYLEKRFSEGMCWELMGKHIHIDHITPLSSAKTEEEIYKLCHYTNLQPLWAEDNLRKSNKILN
jgi:hypothetical protein